MHSRPAPHIVPEESASEFYASLVKSSSGALPYTKKKAVNTPNPPKPPPLSSFGASLSGGVIPANRPRASYFSNLLSSVAIASGSTSVSSQPSSRPARPPSASPPRPAAPSQLSVPLPVSNKGHQLLSKLGWKVDNPSLGKRGTGHSAPLPLLRHPGQAGLGSLPAVDIGKAEQQQQQQQQRQQKAGGKRSREDDDDEPKDAEERARVESSRKRAERERRETRRIRHMLRTDLSDEQEELLSKLKGYT